MRAREFINEQKLSDVHDGLDVAAKALPNTFVLPELKNQDFYDLYRFGVAIADVRGNMGDVKNIDPYKPEFRAETTWGENQIVSSFDPNIGKVIDQALKKVHKSGKRAVSTPGSQEFDDTLKQSPIKAFKGYKR
jgi:hypothetical protein